MLSKTNCWELVFFVRNLFYIWLNSVELHKLDSVDVISIFPTWLTRGCFLDLFSLHIFFLFHYYFWCRNFEVYSYKSDKIKSQFSTFDREMFFGPVSFRKESLNSRRMCNREPLFFFLFSLINFLNRDFGKNIAVFVSFFVY